MNYRTPKELAYEYDVSETTVILWFRTGYFPSIKVGGRWRIDPDVDLESLSNPVNERVREEMKARGWYQGVEEVCRKLQSFSV